MHGRVRCIFIMDEEAEVDLANVDANYCNAKMKGGWISSELMNMWRRLDSNMHKRYASGPKKGKPMLKILMGRDWLHTQFWDLSRIVTDN